MASFPVASRSDTISVDPTPDLLIFRLVVGSSTMVLVGGRSGHYKPSSPRSAAAYVNLIVFCSDLVLIPICVEGCANRDLGLDLAKGLDDSGFVIVLGDVMFLKPEQGYEVLKRVVDVIGQYNRKKLEQLSGLEKSYWLLRTRITYIQTR
ncbi:putative MCU family protein [Helianthus annuus]|uniref:MCU family protein n=2 Tax=Helianthus annuus TaxID=4232 RepID=A0A9K3I721_HELAN|nr:putative MCU family protein [Helianthus annuus]KAJ0525927.1 putative MCU family protein [Helianthus annuus]KAJ0534211.1 putative MCU family protein [Helianthus annuus]KAJ0542322.1 putative MCU family protein [Helianthus annuus]KAJ0707365.1 putative MCU family protein [Helianthus annuus]